MPQENDAQTNPQTCPEVRHFIAMSDGGVFENNENLPLQTILGMPQFENSDALLRFAFVPEFSAIYVQDGKEWHDRIQSGEEEAWSLFNVAARHVREKFKAQPKLHFGEPPGHADNRNLSQYGHAWEKIKEYFNHEFQMDPTDITVVEYVPDHPSAERVSFKPDGGKAGNLTVAGPALFINKDMGRFGQPNYQRINDLIADEYLKNFKNIHPDEWDNHLDRDYELYFAIWSEEDSKTKIFKANKRQRNRLLNEDALRSEPSLKGYRGPLVLFSFVPRFNQLVIQNSHLKGLNRYQTTRQMIRDIRRKMAKTKNIAEAAIIISHDESVGQPFVTKLSKQGALWDFIRFNLGPEMASQPKDIAIIEAPLSRSGDVNAMLVVDRSDEEKLDAERDLRFTHKIHVAYPYIAVDSRLKNIGLKYHEILKAYSKFMPEIGDLPLIEHNFMTQEHDDHSNGVFMAHMKNPKEQKEASEAIGYMLEMGMGPKAILDFFAPRSNLIRREFFSTMVKQALEQYQQMKGQRREMQKIAKTASLDIGINDWYHIGLQESLNEAQHTENQTDAPTAKPFNLRDMKKQPQYSQGPKSTEGLLAKQHDRELSYMKTMEQLLKESRI